MRPGLDLQLSPRLSLAGFLGRFRVKERKEGDGKGEKMNWKRKYGPKRREGRGK